MINRIEVTGATLYVISRLNKPPATIRNFSPEFRGVGNAAGEMGCVVAMTNIHRCSCGGWTQQAAKTPEAIPTSA